jgi:1-acyl-sn-glycerol-3-phosphate acyltransferase
MRPWKTGFVRLARALKTPVVPVAFIGGEECLPGFGPLRALRPILGTIVPIPLAPVPLPTRWKVIFHEPIDVSGDDDPHLAAQRVSTVVQSTLRAESKDRPLRRLQSLAHSLLKNGGR